MKASYSLFFFFFFFTQVWNTSSTSRCSTTSEEPFGEVVKSIMESHEIDGFDVVVLDHE